MRRLKQALVIATLAALASRSIAATLTNRDNSDRKLTIIEGDKQSERVLGAAQSLRLCEHGCVLRIPAGESYVVEENASVSIQEDILYLDAPAR